MTGFVVLGTSLVTALLAGWMVWRGTRRIGRSVVATLLVFPCVLVIPLLALGLAEWRLGITTMQKGWMTAAILAGNAAFWVYAFRRAGS